MVSTGASGFAWVYFVMSLSSELACYFAVIMTAHLRCKYDWEVFMTLSLQPKPEQDMLNGLIAEDEANRLKESLLLSQVMDGRSDKNLESIASFVYSQNPNPDESKAE